MTQKEALAILKTGRSAFITGAAGSGKTHLLNQYIKYLRDNNVGLGITASTGIAATHMGGMTIHAWSGLGIKDSLSRHQLEDLGEKRHLWKRFQEAQVLIIDEISMLHHFRLDLIEMLARYFKQNELPFGGMQVILCGDFFQLPPVSRTGEALARFVYHSPTWQNLDLQICYLEESYRQSDESYLSVLNAIRRNAISERELSLLGSRFNQKPSTASIPTKLYSHNVDVDAENERELDKLSGEIFQYYMTERGNPNLSAILKKSCLAPEVLRLKLGALVMFVKNNFEEGYANGTLGTVVGCAYDSVRVRLGNGKVVEVKSAPWLIEEGGVTKAEIKQLPLRLAWAITVHKSQGLSLDAAEVDLSQSFERGMGYVALSRVRSLAGLSLKGLNDLALQVSEEVLAKDEEFKEASAKQAGKWRKFSLSELTKMQKEFLAKVAPEGGRKKAKKIETAEITKQLLKAGKSLKAIAKERGLTEGTIIGHLEKIKEKDPRADLANLRKELSATRLKKIIQALSRVGMEGGQYRLSPAKAVLGDDFSFEEIRIARLLM